MTIEMDTPCAECGVRWRLHDEQFDTHTAWHPFTLEAP